MTDEANTSPGRLTLDQAVQRLQERRQAKASAKTGQADNDAPANKDKSLNAGEVIDDPKAIDDDSQALDEGAEGEKVEEGTEDSGDVYIVTLKDEKGSDVETEVPVEELIKGYMRQEDYTRKRQKEVSEYKAKMSTVNGLESELNDALQGVVAQMTQELRGYQSIDWNALQAQDPAAYAQQRLAFIEAQGRVNQRYGQIKELQRYREEKANAELEARLVEQTEILQSIIPNWDTRKVELKSYLQSQGITDMTPFIDSQMALLVHKAKQFDDLQQKTKTLVKKKLDRNVPNVMRSGSTPNRGELDHEKIAQLEAQVRKTGSLQDAVALRQAKKGLRS